MPRGKKNCSLDFAAMWIALNDEPTVTDVREVAGFVSTLIAADMLGVAPDSIAMQVVAFRKTFEKDGWPK